MKILIVDDSTVNNIMLENILSEYGYEAHSVIDSKNVLNTIHSYQPDVILLDIMMPGLSGFDILKQMKQKDISIPTIILSAYTSEDYAKQALELGAFEYFSKPFNQKKLIQTIENSTTA